MGVLLQHFYRQRLEKRNTIWKKLDEVLNKGAPRTKIDNEDIAGEALNAVELAEQFNDFFVKKVAVSPEGRINHCDGNTLECYTK